MAIYQLDKISEDVRIALDRNAISDGLVEIGDIDTLSLNDIIRSKIREAVKQVHSDAPAYLLDGMRHFANDIFWGDMESGWVLLPDNFMRLICFKMSDWERPVFQAISADDSEYLEQRSRFKGIRGTSQRPICVITMRPEGRALEFYSCKSKDATVSTATYIPYPFIDKNDGINICERCYDAVVYTIAALTLMTYGDKEQSSQMVELAKTSLT